MTTPLGTLILAFACFAVPLRGQEWNSPRARALAEHATERRAAQLADTALRNYKAEARGYLTFLAQMGEGFTQPPKVVRTDQIASDIYWRAPNFSKQLIKGRRDTLLLPTDIRYHRDHLGIVQNNFPSIIRLGEGDEVRDVPHPLSAAGLKEYDYALRDSLQIQLGPRTLNVYEVRIRPKDERAPRAVGSAYIDRESGEVVRLTLSFTRAALKDPSLVDVSVVLDNGLIEGRFWLPHSQEIEIRRTGTWLDYPVRGIIRGRWEISDYEVNQMLPIDFNGPEIQLVSGATYTASGAVSSPGYKFSGGILDSLPPDVRAASDEDVQKVQEEARALVRAQALARARTPAISGRRISDFIHANRVEGIALGAGVSQGLGNGFALHVGTTYGTSDHEWKPHGGLSFVRPSGAGIDFMAYRELREAGDVAERSGVINSFAAQNFGSDYSDLYRVRGSAITWRSSALAPIQGRLQLAWEREDSTAVHATPASGQYEPAFRALPWRQVRLTLGTNVPTHAFLGGTELTLSIRADGIRGHRLDFSDPTHDFLRGVLDGEVTRAFGTQTLVLRTLAGGVTHSDHFNIIPLQHLLYLGGPVSAPGYDFHELWGRAMFSQRVEWQFKVPFPSVPLATWGRAPGSLTLAPYTNVAWVEGFDWKPSVGVGALSIFDLLRVDVARGLHKGRWTFNLDVNRAFWPVL